MLPLNSKHKVRTRLSRPGASNLQWSYFSKDLYSSECLKSKDLYSGYHQNTNTASITFKPSIKFEPTCSTSRFQKLSFPQPEIRSNIKQFKLNCLLCLHSYSEAFKNQFFVRTVRIWNSLPSEIMNCVREDKFKVSVTEWLRPHQWVKVASTNTWTLV